jgi:hypothetical protein
MYHRGRGHFVICKDEKLEDGDKSVLSIQFIKEPWKCLKVENHKNKGRNEAEGAYRVQVARVGTNHKESFDFFRDDGSAKHEWIRPISNPILFKRRA